MDDGPEQNGFNEFISWEAKSRDTIDFKTIYVDMADDLMAGLMLSQIIYWYLPDKRGRTKLRVQKHGHLWLVKARTDWWGEIRLTARQADRALETLRGKGLITTSLHRFSGAPTTHIRLNKAAFLAAWNEAVANDYSNLPNGEFTDSLIQEGDNLPNGDMELPDPVNSLTETTAETTVTEITISPAGAENSPSQPDPVVAFPETDNPDSVSNGPSEEVIEPLPSAGDYVADVLQRQSAKASFTVPPAASGADSFSDGPVTAYCQIINVSPDELKDKERAKITKVCRRIGERRGVDAAFLADSILMLPESDWAGRCNWFTINPYAGGVEDVINALVARRLSGGPVLKVASRAPPDARTAADYEEGDEVL